jgi:hypothetical protein
LEIWFENLIFSRKILRRHFGIHSHFFFIYVVKFVLSFLTSFID